MANTNHKDDYHHQKAQFIAFMGREGISCHEDHTGYVHFSLNETIHGKAIVSIQRRVIKVVIDLCTLTPQSHCHILKWYLAHLEDYSYLQYRIAENKVQFIWTIPEGCLWSKRIDRQFALVMRVIEREYPRLYEMAQGKVIAEVKDMMMQEYESLKAEWTRSSSNDII